MKTATATQVDTEVTFPDKLLKLLPTGFTDEVASMKDDELKKKVFECEGNLYTIEKEKEGDVKLNAAKDLAKEISAPYREAKSCQSAKVRYILWLLEGRGIDLNNQ